MIEKAMLFERLACGHSILVEEMRAIISARIEQGLHNPDIEKRAQQEKIPCTGEIPTPEELLCYVMGNLKKRGTLIY